VDLHPPQALTRSSVEEYVMLAAMSTLSVVLADPRDAADVEKLLDEAAEWQQGLGFDMWTPGWFGEEVREAIAEGCLYVSRRVGELVGCFMLDQGSPRMTQWLIEQRRTPTSGANIGRLAVSRDSAGLGFGVELLDHARKLAGIQGLTYLWLECPADNARLRLYYLDAGFTYCGDNSVPGPNGEP
jgi:ribosomal protein S18 acetylase RimI-like enzyme